MKVGIPYKGCPYLSQVPNTTEEEAVAFAVGAYLGGTKCDVFMQNSGYGRCLDVITSLLMTYEIPVDIDVSNREDLHHKYMGKLYPILCEELKRLKTS